MTVLALTGGLVVDGTDRDRPVGDVADPDRTSDCRGPRQDQRVAEGALFADAANVVLVVQAGLVPKDQPPRPADPAAP